MKSSRAWLERGTACISRHFLAGLTVLALLIYMFTYLQVYFGVPIRSDGTGYYAYLPSYLIYGDPSLEQNAIVQYGGEYPHSIFIRRQADTGRYLSQYNMGVSLFLLPFFLIAHGVTWFMQSLPGAPEWYAFNHPLNGYSLFYQHAAGLSNVFYFLLAIAILKPILERNYGRSAALFSIIGIVFGTNLLNYGTGDCVSAHPSTLFTISAVLRIVPHWYQDPGSRLKSLALGILLGLLYLIRPPNILFFLIVPLYGLTRLSDVRDRLFFFWNHRASIAWAGISLLLLLIPQVLIWKYATGRYWVNSYEGGCYGWMRPEIWTFLFSINRGMFFWFPVTLISAWGLIALYKNSRQWFWPISVTVIIFIVMMSSYFLWKNAGGFGNRYVVDIALLMSFPLAAGWRAIKRRRIRVLVLLLTAGCVCWTVYLMKLYYTREISFYGLDWPAVFDILWTRQQYLLFLLTGAS